jgi:glycosidase
MLMLPGMPFVYYGEEIGMVGAKPDETIRTPMQWSSASNGGFTTGTPWESLQPDWKTNNVVRQDSIPTSLLNHYRKLIHLRNAHPALNLGPVTMLQTGDTTGTTVAWLRSSPDEILMIVVNFGSRPDQVYTTKLPPILRGGEYRLEPVYADPDHACTGYVATILDFFTPTILVNSVQPHGFCALRLSRR